LILTNDRDPSTNLKSCPATSLALKDIPCHNANALAGKPARSCKDFISQ
jgi:hypothetical protein